MVFKIFLKLLYTNLTMKTLQIIKKYNFLISLTYMSNIKTICNIRLICVLLNFMCKVNFFEAILTSALINYFK